MSAVGKFGLCCCAVELFDGLRRREAVTYKSFGGVMRLSTIATGGSTAYPDKFGRTNTTPGETHYLIGTITFTDKSTGAWSKTKWTFYKGSPTQLNLGVSCSGFSYFVRELSDSVYGVTYTGGYDSSGEWFEVDDSDDGQAVISPTFDPAYWDTTASTTTYFKTESDYERIEVQLSDPYTYEEHISDLEALHAAAWDLSDLDAEYDIDSTSRAIDWDDKIFCRQAFPDGPVVYGEDWPGEGTSGYWQFKWPKDGGGTTTGHTHGYRPTYSQRCWEDDLTITDVVVESNATLDKKKVCHSDGGCVSDWRTLDSDDIVENVALYKPGRYLLSGVDDSITALVAGGINEGGDADDCSSYFSAELFITSD